MKRIKFLRSCSTVSRQFKKGDELDLLLKDGKLIEPDLKEIVKFNDSKGYFEFIEKSKVINKKSKK